MNVRARPLDSPIRADASRQVRAPVRVRAAAAVGAAVVTERARACSYHKSTLVSRYTKKRLASLAVRF